MNKSIFFINVYGCPQVSGDLDKMFSLMKKVGASGLQFHITELMNLDADKFKEQLSENGAYVECVHVTPRLLSEDEEIFKEAVKECEDALGYISSFGCKRLMVVPFTPFDVKDRQKARERFAKGLRLVVKSAEKYGISVVIENISLLALPFSTAEDVGYLLDNVKGLAFCFDIGNFVCTKSDAFTAYEKLKDRIDMVHVKDFGICESGGFACDSGINVKHVDFGTGNAKLEKMLCLLYKNNPDVPYVVEVHNEMPPMDDVVGACDFTDKVWEKCRK
jgi:sugar phosphate isomerase/epimerase